VAMVSAGSRAASAADSWVASSQPGT